MNNAVGPRVQRGVLATVRNNTLGDVVQFQYNPESITRTLTPRMDWGQADNAGASPGLNHSRQAKLIDAAGQSISFKAYFDAADALAAGDAGAIANGVGPQLAVLESLLYPTRDAYQKYESSRANSVGLAVMEAPRTILVWGDRRVFPVRVTSLNIVEEAFTAALNPIRASVDMTVEVVTYGMRTQDDPDYKMFTAYHVGLERLASSSAGIDAKAKRSLAARAQADS